MVAEKFSAGNVPALKDPLRVAQRGLEVLPGTIRERYFRGDSAYDEVELLSWLRDEKRANGPERHAVAAFAHSPGVLDFYVWLVWKCWTVRHHGAHVPLFSEWGLVNQLGTKEYSSDRFFRRKINFWLRQVKALWPECPAHVSDD